MSQVAGNRIRPTIHPLIGELEGGDDRRRIHVAFSGEERSYSCDGRYRVRVADEDLPMSGEQPGCMYVESLEVSSLG